jgi:hypothetical protein
MNHDNNSHYYKRTGSSILIISILVFSAFVVTLQLVSAQKDFLPPNHGFSENYYYSYGEPEIYASVFGDPEFEKGTTGQLKIILANKGVLYGFKPATQIKDDEDEEYLLSLKELEYEAMRTTAIGIKATLESPSRYIEINPKTSSQTLEELIPGKLPDTAFVFNVEVSKEAPAEDYVLQMPISYEYQREIEMTNGDLIRLGINDMDHITQYKNIHNVLAIPIRVKQSAEFAVTNVFGTLTSGSTGMINVTYKNIGEIAANECIARIVVMQPLSTEKPTALLGSMEPGESKTVSYTISASKEAVTKNYGVDAEIKYENEDGKTELSDNLKVDIPLEASNKGLSASMISISVIILLVMIYLIVNNVQKREY